MVLERKRSGRAGRTYPTIIPDSQAPEPDTSPAHELTQHICRCEMCGLVVHGLDRHTCPGAAA